MRRIASIFNSRRSDKDKPAKTQPPPSHIAKSSRLFRSRSHISVATQPSIPKLDQAQSSSSSSSGSASLRTPDDDHASPMNPTVHQKPWTPWTASKKPTATLRSSPSQPLGRSNMPDDSIARLPPKPQAATHDDESEDDTSESSESDEERLPSSKPIARTLPPVEYAQSLTANHLAAAFSPYPLFYRPGTALFPRSANSSRSVSFRDSIESTMHKQRLLRKILRDELSPSERRSLAAFGSRPASAAVRRTLPLPDEGAFPDVKHVTLHSRGLKRWIQRPYFEERTVVWTVGEENGAIGWTRVKGSGFGVWALEVSEGLELLAGPTGDELERPSDDVAAWEPPSSASSSSSQLSASPPVTQRAPPLKYKALPSPLRNESDPIDPPLPSPTNVPSLSPSISQALASAAVPAPKRGVHFAEDNKDDQLPIGYVLRVKKKREEKARFLKVERDRRALEEERLKHEAERRQWEKERQQWEQEKNAIERERRAAEEERKKKLYADELAAARSRRESQHSIPSSSSREMERRGRATYARPTYDSRRQSDQHAVYLNPARSHTGSSSIPRSDSASRSHTASPAPRAPSMYSNQSSSEDVRLREGRSSRRASMVSESSQRSDRMPMYPYVWGIPPVPPLPTYPSMPMIPVMPQYVMDMPLLPPAAPFMRQQHGQRSRSSNSPSPARGSLPDSHSSDRIHQASPHLSAPQHGHHRHSSSDDYRRRDSSGSHGGPPSEGSGSSLGRPPRQQSLLLGPTAPSYFSQNRPSSYRRSTAIN